MKTHLPLAILASVLLLPIGSAAENALPDTPEEFRTQILATVPLGTPIADVAPKLNSRGIRCLSFILEFVPQPTILCSVVTPGGKKIVADFVHREGKVEEINARYEAP